MRQINKAKDRLATIIIAAKRRVTYYHPVQLDGWTEEGSTVQGRTQVGVRVNCG